MINNKTGVGTGGHHIGDGCGTKVLGPRTGGKYGDGNGS